MNANFFVRNYKRSTSFRVISEKKWQGTTLDTPLFSLYGFKEAHRERIISQPSSEYYFERSGVLLGEYVALPDGFTLVDKTGRIIIINVNTYANSAEKINQHLNTDQFHDAIEAIRQYWDNIPHFSNIPIISEGYSWNYYHFSTGLIPKIRFFDNSEIFAVPANFIEQNYQKSLLSKAFSGNRKVIPMTTPIRVTDPLFADALIPSPEAIQWLRKVANVPLSSGDKRYYLRRPPTVSRSFSGGVTESPDFLQFLADFHFEVVEFGTGAYSVEQQIAMLDNAGVVLAPHGAAMTNCLYLNSPTHVIEMLSPKWAPVLLYGAPLEALSLHYHGVLCEQLDETGNMIVDCTLLRDIMATIGR